MLRKTMLLSAAVAALTALAPGAASAEVPTPRNWEHNTVALMENRTMVLHGIYGFVSAAGGISCPTTAEMILKPGSTGTVVNWSVSNTAECKFTGGLAALCGTVTAHEATKLPWVVHSGKFASNGKYGFTITEVEMHRKATGAFCPNVTTTGDLRLTVDDPHKMNLIHLESGTKLHSPTTGGNVNAFGTFEATPAQTYGIET